LGVVAAKHGEKVPEKLLVVGDEAPDVAEEEVVEDEQILAERQQLFNKGGNGK
jgi:hypothetical protein